MPIRQGLSSQYKLIRTCLEGDDSVKAAGEWLTPRPDAMTAQQYAAYLNRGHFSGVPEMTLRALVGIAGRKAPVVKLPARLEPLRLNATDDNAPLSILLEDVLRDVLSLGRVGLLLDFPASGTSVNTVPHIARFEAECISDYTTAFVDGHKVLTRVVLEADEDFDGSQVHYELLLEDGIYRFRRFLLDETKTRVNLGDEVIPTVNGRPLTQIPFVLLSHEGIRPEDVTPPFLSLCKTALAHFATSCDRRHALHLTASPTPWISGSVPANKVPQAIGAGALWLLPENCAVGQLEFTGAGVSAMRDEMADLESMMVSMGARMLSTTINRNEDISTASMRTRSELSLLHGAVVSTEAALNFLLRLAAEWVGASPDETSITLSRDFLEVTADPKMIEANLKLWQSGAISRQTLWENLQQGEVAPADRTWEEEKTLIEEEGGDLSPPFPILGNGGLN